MGRLGSLARFAKWLAITIACALPAYSLSIDVDIRGDAGKLAGIVTWAAGMSWFERLAATRRWPVRVDSLALGFTIWAAFQGIVALLAYRFDLGWFGAPYVACALLPMVFAPGVSPLGAESSVLVLVFAMTLSCGIPNLAFGMLAANFVEAWRHRRGKFDATGRS
jgi:hypothetical protein